MLERRFLELVRQAGLPRPATQVVHRDGGRTFARVDFLWPELGVVVEVSGRRGHVSDAERARDAQRRNELQDVGLRVYEYTWDDVTRRPEHVAASCGPVVAIDTLGVMGEPLTLWCDDLDGAVEALRAAGMRLDVIMPADAPAVAELSGERCRRAASSAGPRRRRRTTGRAGMIYRDLLPEREGGRFIASHITIPDGGPVPDYVHHHDVRFQVIHCVRGWVRVVYEDQGEPFTMHAGDTVLQPPHIRHRVLESSPGLEVFELTGPAEHPTFVEHDITLPTPDARPDRDFGGQRFVRHELATATLDAVAQRARASRPPTPASVRRRSGWAARAPCVRRRAGAELPPARHDAELVLWFVERRRRDGHARRRAARTLTVGDAVAVPAGVEFALTDCSRRPDVLRGHRPSRTVRSRDSLGSHSLTAAPGARRRGRRRWPAAPRRRRRRRARRPRRRR